MLEQIVNDDIEVGVEASDWEDAIRKSARYLLEQGKIEPGYIDAMIDSVHRNGPYIVITNHVALAHARPECGVNELGVHYTVLKEGVPFGVESLDPVSLIITLAAVDDTSHLELMGELAVILMEPENVNKLISSESPKQFRETLMHALP